jgi:hypothetical protein
MAKPFPIKQTQLGNNEFETTIIKGVCAEMSIPNQLKDMSALEREIYVKHCALGREEMKLELSTLDEQLMLTRDQKVYRHKGKRKTVLKTVMGEVEYARVMYEYVDESGRKGYNGYAKASIPSSQKWMKDLFAQKTLA